MIDYHAVFMARIKDVSQKMALYKTAQNILQRKVSQGKFSNWIRFPGGGFLSYWNHQLIKFEEEKRFGL